VGTAALPALPISWVVMHPRLHRLLFVATDLGLFHSTDGGGSWSPILGGPENVCIDQLVWRNDRELLCVTHGRGVYAATLPLAGTQSAGQGCAAGAQGVLSATSPVVGTTAQFALAAGRSNAPVFFAVNFGGPVQVPLGGCTVAVDLNIAAAYFSGATDGAGAWSHSLVLPPIPSIVGAELTAQAFLLGVGGPMFGVGDLSNGLHLHLGL